MRNTKTIYFFIKLLHLSGYLGLAVSLCGVKPAQAANRIQTENALPGAVGWEIKKPALNRQIEGYASQTSVNAGGQIQFFVNTAESSYTFEMFRMGWYNGLGARQVVAPVTLPGTVQVIPSPDPSTGLTECHWTNPFTQTIPAGWTSGIYLVKLTAVTSKTQSYMIFVVRNDGRTTDFLLQQSVTTYQAYNEWGGRSFYSNSTGGPAAVKVSFDRPYGLSTDLYGFGLGTGDFLRTNAAWEYNMIRFLEKEGYDVSYCTDIDAHEKSAQFSSAKALLVVGHSEYWSWQMRTNVEAARDSGLGIGFFSGNSCYWQIRMEANSSAIADRTMVGYKDNYFSDPFNTDPDTSKRQFVTRLWRENCCATPENTMIGVMFRPPIPVDTDLVIQDASSFALANTGLVSGSAISGVVGVETDGVFPNGPASLQVIAHSPIGSGTFSDMTSYTTALGKTVFATGTIQWSWGVDDYNAPNFRSSRLSAAAQQLTRNVLDRLRNSVVPPTADSVSPSSGTGASQVFTFRYSSANGSGNIANADAMFNTTLGGSNACLAIYDKPSRRVYLYTDIPGNGASGSLAVAADGSISGSLSNTQCTLNGTGSSVTGSGNTLTMLLNMTFTASFAGTSNVFLYASDDAGMSSNWQTRGTWTVAGTGFPTADSVSPSSGTGASQVFTFRYSSPNGSGFLANADAMFNTTLGGPNACLALYDKPTRRIYLYTDIPGNGASGSLAVAADGSVSGSLANPQCTLNGTGSSVTGSGNTLTMGLNMTFTASFAGAKNIFMFASDDGGMGSNWQIRGTWTVFAAGFPTADSVSPSSGKGAIQKFTLRYSSASGFGFLANADVMFNTTLGGSNACLLLYDKPTRQIYLYTDIPGNGASGSLVIAADGSLSGSLSNPQCTLNGSGSSLKGAGNTLTMVLNMSFTPSFTGTKNVFMYTSDDGGMASDWQTRGTWTAP